MKFKKGDYVAHVGAINNNLIEERDIYQITFINSLSMRIKGVIKTHNNQIINKERFQYFRIVKYYKDTPLFRSINE